DFYDHGLEPASADLVVIDAAFHHASDPSRFARVAYDLTRPGGVVMLLREPTLTFAHRSRDHGLEGQHGSFEHEYTRRDYVRFLEGGRGVGPGRDADRPQADGGRAGDIVRRVADHDHAVHVRLPQVVEREGECATRDRNALHVAVAEAAAIREEPHEAVPLEL